MAAVNRIVDVYCASGRTRYAVDVSKYGKDSEEFNMLVSNMRSLRLSPGSSDFTPCDAFDFAIELLAYNDCFDAILHPDLWEEENAKAAERARSVDWDKYEYAAILVPGQGPEFPRIKVSPLAQLKMRLAVAELQKGRAPFVVVSGGTVHPAHTAVNEAVEMGIWLTDSRKLNLDRGQVVLEPYSRHTTTNLRNTARVVKRLGAPEGKPILIVSGEEQIRDILGPMQRRAQVELTHVLGTIMPGSTDFTAVYIPSPLCEIVDPMDPRDP
ncbi:hypothetical protein FB45DRAFT_887620 [Roridomyces roridus]|uniref:DUF218 domain-containing protein n=1 Tax=Roridomyces roridus TaxID=1738132 RepID=A0AAD7CJ52_9AGAR|nr:hypothetical protein FB45DRAFT_887620 [Roridomyces roridus]